VNSSPSRETVRGARLRARILGLDGTEKFARDSVVDLPADSSRRVFYLPAPSNISGAYFVDVRLTGADGRPLSNNFYWLSTHPDVLADTSTWYMTEVKSYADFTALRSMPQVTVTAAPRFTSSGGNGNAQVTLRNTSSSLAFFIRLQVVGRTGEEALPVIWDDNYVSLLPGETRVLSATYRVADLHGGPPRLLMSGWNVRPLPATRAVR
jgi:exo-1,4-beta-D-glucosaminidase